MARDRARQMGGVGALYAWNSISGEECGVVYEAATAEYHLLCAIAWAIRRYVESTGDVEFLHGYGAEMLFETSRFLVDRGCYIPTRGKHFCINVVCGPDEYGCGVNNNCYTNVMVQWHLRFAAEVYRRMQRAAPAQLGELTKRIGLQPAEVQAWSSAADAMYIPYHKALRIHMQDDSFVYLDPVDMTTVAHNTDIREDMHPLNLWRIQVAKQADVVLLMFVQGQQFTLEEKRRNYAYYEPRTNHGSSLSACIHSIVACEVGRHDDAYAYFRQSSMMDLNDFKNNTGGGVHAACLGGTWMAVVNGFAGLRDYSDGLHFRPLLPPAWLGYRFKTLYRGSRIAVEVKPDATTFTLLEGTGLSFFVAEKKLRLSAERPSASCATLPWSIATVAKTRATGTKRK
jgi:alpha,alpha-trehalose phosphorylase